MAFDGTRYCAWLPAPAGHTKTVEYYIEAYDVSYETSRTRSFELSVRKDCPATPEPARAPAIVKRTTPGEGSVVPGFDPATYKLEP